MRVSKYVNQTKVVNDLAFTTVSYLKGKVEVKAEGYQGSIWIGTQTWKNAKANVSKRSCFHIESKRFKLAFEKATTTTELSDVIDERARGEVSNNITSMAWMLATSIDGTKRRKEQMKVNENEIKWNELDETVFNEQLEIMLGEIDENNEFRQKALFNAEYRAEHEDKLTAEAHKNGFDTYEDYINWYFDSENENQIKMYEMSNENHDYYRFIWNVQRYLKKSLENGYTAFNKSYKQLAKQYHPDMGGTDWQMAEVKEWKEKIQAEYIEDLKKMYQATYNALDSEDYIKYVMEDEWNDLVRFGIVA